MLTLRNNVRYKSKLSNIELPENRQHVDFNESIEKLDSINFKTC